MELVVTSMSEIRMIVVTVAAASFLAVMAPGAEAHHRPSAFCSESGDVRQSVRKVDGVRRLRIALAERYFERFYLCVRDPDGGEVCESHRIRERSDGTFGRSVAWRNHIWFQRTAGPYIVRWLLPDGASIGAKLGFHVR